MFHVGYILNIGHAQFGDFWKCLDIFSNATNLQNKRKIEIKESGRYILECTDKVKNINNQKFKIEGK